MHKRNTFTDFIDCGRALVDMRVAVPGRLSCEGRSAGGLLVGNVINMAPELWCAAVAGVPFVDLMTTMCDPSIPLTTEGAWISRLPRTPCPARPHTAEGCTLASLLCAEWEEWGNPNEEKYYE